MKVDNIDIFKPKNSVETQICPETLSPNKSFTNLNPNFPQPLQPLNKQSKS